MNEQSGHWSHFHGSLQCYVLHPFSQEGHNPVPTPPQVFVPEVAFLWPLIRRRGSL